MKLSKASVISPIIDSLYFRYQTIYKKLPKKDSIEFMILEEAKELETKLSKDEALLFVHTLLELNLDMVPNDQKLWREFVYIHLLFLNKQEMLHYPVWLFRYVSLAIDKENITDSRYIKLLSNKKWVMKTFQHALMIDYSSSLVHQYKMDQLRVTKIFLFLCRVMENALKRFRKETDFNLVQKELLKLIKSYQPSQLFQRKVI